MISMQRSFIQRNPLRAEARNTVCVEELVSVYAMT